MALSGAITEDMMRAAKEAFEMVDADKDGIITRDELEQALRSIDKHRTAGELTDIIAAFGKEGKLTLSGWLLFVERNEGVKEDERDAILKSFKNLDRNGDGLITADEIRAAVADLQVGPTLSDEQLSALIAKCDVDGDGSINYAEFTYMLLSGL